MVTDHGDDPEFDVRRIAEGDITLDQTRKQDQGEADYVPNKGFDSAGHGDLLSWRGIWMGLGFKFGFIGGLWFAVGEAISLPQICENQR